MITRKCLVQHTRTYYIKYVPCRYMCGRTIASDYLPVIRVPQKSGERKQINNEKSREKKRIFDHKVKMQSGDISKPVIYSKKNVDTHFDGQVYSKFSKVPLCSKYWSSSKSVGDNFSIKYAKQHPSVMAEDSNINNFMDVGLTQTVVEALAENGFNKPTIIQAEAIPRLLQGNNAIIASETGNGKTLAYLAPILQKIMSTSSMWTVLPPNSPLALVICPGRELAIQIAEVAEKLCKNLNLKVDLILGVSMRRKIRFPTMKRSHITIATVGALSKLTTMGIFKTNLLRYIVLDEADTLLDDSFKDAIVRFLNRCPIQGDIIEDEDDVFSRSLSGLQLVLCGATTPKNFELFLKPAVEVSSIEKITTPQLHKLQPHVEQRFYRVGHNNKAEKLLQLVKGGISTRKPTIIFSNDGKTSEWLSMFLNDYGIQCINFSASLTPRVRNGIFEKFQTGEIDVISCTDIASRGLDTIRAKHIINFQFPLYMSDYIHRCGRTGRIGGSKSCMVTSFIQHKWDVDLLHKIEYAARKKEEFVNVNANIKGRLKMRAERKMKMDDEGSPTSVEF